MTNRILENGLNVKDDKRLANASSKLSSNQLGDSYTFKTEVTPVMIAGIEENPTLSTVDLITCIRDQNGVNRLCTDIRGVATLTKEQTNIGGAVPFNTALTQNIVDTQSMPNTGLPIPDTQTLFITHLVLVNEDIVPTEVDVKKNGTSILAFYLPSKTSTIISDLNIPLSLGDILTGEITLGGVGGAYNGIISFQGVLQ